MLDIPMKESEHEISLIYFTRDESDNLLGLPLIELVIKHKKWYKRNK